jgi:sporulation protein YqfC
MEKKERKEGLLEKTAQLFDLPGDVIAGLPRIELTGDRELRMEHHRGILSYGDQEIHISGGKLIVKVRGSGLELRAMNGEELLITGFITGVDLT